MRAIYRASFTLKSDKASANSVIDRTAQIAFKWALDPKRFERFGKVPSIQPLTSAASLDLIEIMPRWKVQAHRVDSGKQLAWGFRLTHPDGEYPNLSWATEITVTTEDDQSPFFTCSSLVGDSGQVFVPIRRRPSRPRIVADVLEQIGGTCLIDDKESFPLLTTPLDLTESDSDREIFLWALTSEKRTHPIVFISVDNDTQRPLVEHLKVASHLSGLAHVILARNSAVSWNLRDHLPQHLNCYHGAVRLYWPRLKLSDPGYLHPLWSPQQIDQLGRLGTKEVSLQLLETIAGISAFKVPDHFLTWDRLIELGRKKAIAEAKERALADERASGKKNEWAELLEEENASLNQENRVLKEQLADRAEALEQQRSIAESYRFALEQERRQVPAIEAEDQPALPAASVPEAIQKAKRDHDGKLVFAFNNKSEDKDSPFQTPQEVEHAFNWLATTYWDARSGAVPCSDLDLELKAAIPGWSYSGGQKRHSVGKHEAWYQCKWDGKDYWIGEHLGCGTSKRPEETIRIAFAWDDERNKVVLGYIGQHQRNANT